MSKNVPNLGRGAVWPAPLPPASHSWPWRRSNSPGACAHRRTKAPVRIPPWRRRPAAQS